MDACIDPKSKLIWPVKDFLLNTSLSCNNLGLLASASGSLKEPYIPVKAQGVLEKAEDNTPTVKIISSTRLSKIRWRVLGQNTWNYVKGFNFPGRMGIEFQLNNSIKGELAIEIEGEMYSKKGEWLALDHPVKVKIP